MIRKRTPAPRSSEEDVKTSRSDIRAFLEPALYLLPFFLGIVVFTFFPILNVFLMSFKEKY